MSDERLCPRCGAYWSCDCPRDDLVYVPVAGCDHDWTEAVGVDLDTAVQAASEESHVFMCRHCGIYAVSETNAGVWRR